MTDPRAELERAVEAALETYSNVHRGSGHHSVVTTHLFDEARQVVLEHLGLDPHEHTAVFCTPRAAERLCARLPAGGHRVLSSEDVGLPLGLRAVAVRREALPRGVPPEPGGGTARLVAPSWVVWARAPERFEAGTPPIVNVVAFAKALRLVREHGADALREAGGSSVADTLEDDPLPGGCGRELLGALRETLIGRDSCVPTIGGPRRYVNLDNAASTPTFAPIWNAVRRAWRQPRELQQQIVAEVRSICAEALGAPLGEHELVFTSNTTEAINLVADALGRDQQPGVELVVVNTLLEHNSNELPWRNVPGASLVRLPVDPEGFVDADELESVLRAHNEEGRHGRQRVRLVAVSGASNVLGSCNDLAAIGRIVHRYGARLLVDAAQLVAHRRVEMAAWGIDYLAFSAHKVYAPFGSGVLLARKGLLPFTAAQMEPIRASGEENVGGIAALGTSLALLLRIGLDVVQEEEQALTRYALGALAQLPGVKVFGVSDASSPRFARKGGVIAFAMKGAFADKVAGRLAERGIGVRYGCHCAHLLVKRVLGVPKPLESFQRVIVTVFPRLELPGVARVSFGLQSTPQDVDALVEALCDMAQPRRSAAAAATTAPLRPEDVRRRTQASAAAVAERVYGPHPIVGGSAS